MSGIWTGASVSLKCTVASNVVFWPLALLGLYVDNLTASGAMPRLLRRKLQPDKHLSSKERRDLVLLSALNMLFVAPLICCPIFEALWEFMQGSSRRRLEDDEWVWTHELLVKLPIHAIIAEIWFYAMHVLLHTSAFLYGTIHKIHHRFSSPTAMACVYAHPVEFALGNIFPIFLGPMLTNAHPMTCYVFWFPAAMVGTCKGHCGYQLPGLRADPHDDHHTYFRCNYGGMALADILFGTYQQTKNTK
eukprot:CAMPEP_0181034062 /NCGR_PEP_ID=MMETSP1070-20121207/7608_1 /TAXON_ID=265543 /ORGANISM="Minutocellus polymorphus, Strain NH13" /LENGTH=246 /DNA_ID=CAMNT_0023111567 /DNA_START=64 /DNA_END=804 /DNA_ORIENTATION=-